MRKALLKVVIGFLLWALAPGVYAGDDFQTWHTVEIVKKLNPEWDIFFMPEARTRDDSSDLFYHEYREGIRYKPNKNLQLGLNYLFVRNQNTSGRVLEEHTGELDVTPKAKWGPLDLSLRWRLALRTIERSAGEQEFQMRFMPKVAYPTRFAGWKVTPYAASDLFYDYTRDAFNQVRLFLGVSLPLKSRVPGVETSVDFYYMNQNQLGAKRHDWSSNQVLGAKWGVRF